jgi:glutathione S-transferase
MRLFDYAPSGNCFKVRLLLHLLQQAYQRVPVDIFSGETLEESYAAVNPMRRVPVLEIAPDVYLPESNAILLHLAERSDYLPADRVERAQAYRWLMFERSHFAPGVAGARFYELTGRAEHHPRAFQAMFTEGADALGVLDETLSSSPFLAGSSLSVADISVYAYAHVAEDAGYDLTTYPHVQEWIARCAATPGWMQDLEPYPPNAMAGASRSIYD